MPNGSSPTSASATAPSAEFLDQRLRALANPLLLAPRERQRERVGEKAAARDGVRADHDVLAHGHGAEQREVLKRAGDAERAISCLRRRQQRAALEADRAALRP